MQSGWNSCLAGRSHSTYFHPVQSIEEAKSVFVTPEVAPIGRVETLTHMPCTPSVAYSHIPSFLPPDAFPGICKSSVAEGVICATSVCCA